MIPMRKAALASALLLALLVVVGCGAPKKTGTSKPTTKVSTPKPIEDAAGLTCVSVLKTLNIPTSSLTLPSGSEGGTAQTWNQITLAQTLTGGPFTPSPQVQSSIQTALENLLSTAAGLPLNADFGETVTEVDLSNGPAKMATYTCLETGGKVIGAWAKEKYFSFEPGSLVAVNGRTMESLTGTDFLTWLTTKGYYQPSAVLNTDGMSSKSALLSYLSIFNEPTLTDSQKGPIITSLVVTGKGKTSTSTIFKAFVPLAVTPFTPKGSVSSKVQQEYGVSLWPDFKKWDPSYLQQNGFQYMYFLMVPSGHLWKVGGVGPAPIESLTGQ